MRPILSVLVLSALVPGVGGLRRSADPPNCKEVPYSVLSVENPQPLKRKCPHRTHALRVRTRHFLALARKVYRDIKVLRDVPTVAEVSTWKRTVLVVEEGFSRQVSGSTHFYNMMTMEIPTLATYVLEPLLFAGKLYETKIVLPKEQPACGKEANERSGELSGASLTWENLRANCRSGLEMLPSFFPAEDISFRFGVPFCWQLGNCKAPRWVPAGLRQATVLFIPRMFPLGHTSLVEGCSTSMMSTTRKWANMISNRPPSPPKMITMIQRGPDVEARSAHYHYERPTGAVVKNWGALYGVSTPLAAKWNFTVQLILFEDIPLVQQIQIARNTRIFIGYEGAGLSHLMYLDYPVMSGVIELNSENGKTSPIGEYPILAHRTTTWLWQHVFRCYDNPNAGVRLEGFVKVLQTALNFLTVLEGR